MSEKEWTPEAGAVERRRHREKGHFTGLNLSDRRQAEEPPVEENGNGRSFLALRLNGRQVAMILTAAVTVATGGTYLSTRQPSAEKAVVHASGEPRAEEVARELREHKTEVGPLMRTFVGETVPQVAAAAEAIKGMREITTDTNRRVGRLEQRVDDVQASLNRIEVLLARRERAAIGDGGSK